jgi:hypothetical protein
MVNMGHDYITASLSQKLFDNVQEHPMRELNRIRCADPSKRPGVTIKGCYEIRSRGSSPEAKHQ